MTKIDELKKVYADLQRSEKTYTEVKLTLQQKLRDNEEEYIKFKALCAEKISKLEAELF